jgi:hypothetical protein
VHSSDTAVSRRQAGDRLSKINVSGDTTSMLALSDRCKSALSLMPAALNVVSLNFRISG